MTVPVPPGIRGDYRPSDMPPTKIERNPEAIWPLRKKHVRVLEHMLNHRLGRAAQMKPQPHNYLMAEIGALQSAIATLNEVLAAREDT